MRTKHLFFAALALPLAFVACNNEELVLENQPQVESTNIVGAELIAHSATVNLVEGVDSRFTNGAFDGTDRLGLAWYNNPKVSGQSITSTQGSSFKYEDTDGYIYNNALVKKDMEAGKFFVNGDIYSGAYFLYFPYQKVGKVSPLTVDYADYKQTEAYTKANVADKQMEHALHLSHKMILSSDNVDADFNIDIEALPVRAASAIGVLANLGSKGTYSDELVDLVSLKSVSINANKVNFTTKATINQFNLPQAVKIDGEFDANKTADAIVEAIYDTKNVLNVDKQSATIKTLVEYDNNIADENIVLLYSFPASVTTKSTAAKIIVETNVGTFTYDQKIDEDEPNYETIQKLLQYANGEFEIGVDGEGDPIYFGFDKYNSKNASLSLTLDMEDLVLTKSISSAEQWNDLMPFYEAAGENVEVTLSKDITFTEAEPFTLPEGIDVTVKAGTKTITFEGNQTIDKNFIANVDVVVAEDATLNINEIAILGNIDNNGTINVAEDAEIKGCAEGMLLTNATGIVNCDGKIVTNMEIANADGIINVTYGKTYIEHDGNGIIAGVLDGNDTDISKDYVAAIYKMIPENSNSAVNCNQLTLKNFDVKLGDETSPWSEVDYTIATNTFEDINLILENSSLDSNESTLNVNNIVATNSPLNGEFNVTKNLETEGEALAGTYTVGGNMSATSATIEGEYTIAGYLVAEESTMNGSYTVNGISVLNKVVVEAGSVINTSDMSVSPASTFTYSNLNADDVEFTGTGTVTFKGTTLNAAAVTINKATLALKNYKLDKTTTISSQIYAAGKIENENGGKVTKETGCTTEENYDAEKIEDYNKLQEQIKLLGGDAENYTTLVNYLNVHHSDKAAGIAIMKIINKYVTVTGGSVTVDQIQLFEYKIGKNIIFN